MNVVRHGQAPVDAERNAYGENRRMGRVRQSHLKTGLCVSLGSFLLVLIMVESLFAVLGALTTPFISCRWAGGNTSDPVLGYKMRPNARVHDRHEANGKVLYEVEYHSNEHRRRIVPVPNSNGRDKFIAFFGCSFTFGLGVDDAQTLPACVGRLAPTYLPYNFAYQGWGPQQMLVTLQEPLEREVTQPRGIGVYVYIPDHIYRAIGAMHCVNSWTPSFPCFEIEHGDLKYRGSFAQAHPWKLDVFHVLGWSPTLRYFKFTWPMDLRESDYELTARIISEAATAFHKKWPESPFYVLFYPYPHIEAEDRTRQMEAILKAQGLPCLRFDGLIERGVPEGQRTSDDCHPSAAANEVLAAALAEALHIGSLSYVCPAGLAHRRNEILGHERRLPTRGTSPSNCAQRVGNSSDQDRPAGRPCPARIPA